MVELIEHLKACVEVASSRTVNWQTFCLKHETILSFLLQVDYFPVIIVLVVPSGEIYVKSVLKNL